MQSTPGRWFGAGHSAASDSAKAGAEATTVALAGRTPQAVFVFASAGHDLPALLDAVRAEAGPEPAIVGGTALGELSSTGGASRGGVSVTALGGDGFQVGTRLAYVGGNGHREAGAEVAAALTGIDRPHQALLLLCEGMSGNPHEIVRGAYSVLGAAVPLVGGLTAHDKGGARSYQFHGDRVVTGAVIGVGIGSDAPIGIGVGHGWHRVEPPMVITRSDQRRILELDGEHALDVLLRHRGLAPTDALLTPGRRMEALGLSRRSGEDMRVITEANADDRSVTGLATMPQGSICWRMAGDRDSMIAGAEASCREALDALGGRDPLGVLAFDCGGRLGELGADGVREEVEALRKALGDVPFGGAYTLGEIARVRGSLGTHALTLVTMALA
ncbi:FIST signal transduction protein [Symbioplanes lichenis]|uniref:FIST signal transduction protein n=1 Tax=Symbioplanes lichenis TaxID=1629072 RepID=UPI002739B6A6|nr:FIST N-terminal domain-containing protein [Actinoplanes lichenis]